jgi:hypothetical protein
MAEHSTKHLDLASDPKETAAATTPAGGGPPPLFRVSEPYNPDPEREATRGQLARGLLWLLTFAIGGVLVFVGLGRLDGTVITQSIFPSLIALAGTALGFYFGSQTAKNSDSTNSPKSQPLVFAPASSSGTRSPNKNTSGDGASTGQAGGT